MIQTWLYIPQGTELLEESDWDLETVLDDVRKHWNEEPKGSQLFWFTDDKGELLATMFRSPTGDPEIAHTVYADGIQGTRKRHRCHYVYGDTGTYSHTEVSQIR